ncbi:fibronectin type III domain-containing protein [Candidatus Daviesbacteria bacterium]|nr:fibronectin type III domain-containing protein [Candidatus Daviesbacteria bacterium]
MRINLIKLFILDLLLLLIFFLNPNAVLAASNICCSKGEILSSDQKYCFDGINTSTPVTVCQTNETCDGSTKPPTCIPPAPLAAPTGLKVTSTTKDSINIAWNKIPGATSYKVWLSYKDSNGQEQFVPYEFGDTASAGLLKISSGITYKIHMKACDSSGCGPDSNEVSASLGGARQGIKAVPIGDQLKSLFSSSDEFNNATGKFKSLPGMISMLANVAIYVSGFLTLYWLLWGVFAYIAAGGDKERLAKARSRIQWAIIGFLVVIISFAVSQYAESIYTRTTKLTPVSTPTSVTKP